MNTFIIKGILDPFRTGVLSLKNRYYNINKYINKYQSKPVSPLPSPEMTPNASFDVFGVIRNDAKRVISHQHIYNINYHITITLVLILMLRGVTGGLQVRPLRCQLGHKGQGGQSGNVQCIQLSGSAGGSRCSGLRSYQTGLRSRRPWSPPHRIYTSTPGRCQARVVSPTSLLLGYKSGLVVQRIL